MKTRAGLAGGLMAVLLVAGCETVPPGVERGPNGTIAYNVAIEASEPGVRIEANGEPVGTAPMTLTIYGDKDGTFHDFGSYTYVVQAFPVRTNANEYVQTRVFRTGRMFTPQDYIPRQIYFDMTQQPPTYPAGGYPPPPYYYPYPYPDPYYYYYGPPVFWGPRVFIGPRVFRHGPDVRRDRR